MKLHHPLWLNLLPRLGVGLLHGLYRTCRLATVGQEQEAALLAQGSPILYTIWHCQLCYVLYHYRHRQGVLMASPSRDGELIGRIAEGFGFIVCRGSRHKGGHSALQEMAHYIRRGHSAGLIADGSRGPARVAQKGVLYLAREAQVPILPLAVASRHKFVFNTWDQFELTRPFSDITLMVGEPLFISPPERGRRLAQLRRELEDRLNSLFIQSQHYYWPRPGHVPSIR